MKYDKKKHEELIADYRSEANLKRIRDYQLDPEEYLEDQKNYDLYAKIIDKDIIKPYLKQNEDKIVPFKKARVRNGVLAGIFFLADLLTFTLAAVLKSPLPSWSISMIGGGFAGFGASFMFCAIEAGKVVRDRKNKNAKLSTEWEVLKETPAYVKEFMFRNGVVINGTYDTNEQATAVKSGTGIISPVDDEWLF